MNLSDALEDRRLLLHHIVSLYAKGYTLPNGVQTLQGLDWESVSVRDVLSQVQMGAKLSLAPPLVQGALTIETSTAGPALGNALPGCGQADLLSVTDVSGMFQRYTDTSEEFLLDPWLEARGQVGSGLREAVYEAFLLSSGLFGLCSREELSIWLFEVRVAFGISEQEHCAALEQLSMLNGHSPSTVSPEEVFAFYTQQKLPKFARQLIPQLSLGFGYRFELIRHIFTNRQGATGFTNTFLQRQCHHFVLGFVSCLRVSNRSQWQLGNTGYTTTQVEGFLSGVFSAIVSEKSRALEHAEVLLSQVAPQLANMCVAALPSIDTIAPSGILASGLLQSKSSRTKLRSRLDMFKTAKAVAEPTAPDFFFPYALLVQGEVGWVYLEYALLLCFPQDPGIEVDADNVMNLLGAIAVKFGVDKEDFTLLQLRSLFEAYKRDSRRWRRNLQQMLVGVKKLEKCKSIKSAVRLRRQVAFLEDLMAHLEQSLLNCYSEFVERPAVFKYVVTLYVDVHERLFPLELPDHSQSEPTVLSTGLKQRMSTLIDDVISKQYRLERSDWVANDNAALTSERFGRFVQEIGVPLMEALRQLIPVMAQSVGISIFVLEATCFRLMVHDLGPLLQKVPEAMIDDLLFGVFKVMMEMVNCILERGLDEDVEKIMEEVAYISTVVAPMASNWLSRVQGNFRDYFNTLIRREDWGQEVCMGTLQQTTETFSTTVIDLFHIFNTNIPLMCSLLVEDTTPFIRGYAQTIGGFMQEYASYICDFPGPYDDPPHKLFLDSGGCHGFLANARRVLDFDPTELGCDHTPTIRNICFRVNTLVQAQVEYHKSIALLKHQATLAFSWDQSKAVDESWDSVEHTSDWMATHIHKLLSIFAFQLIFSSAVGRSLVHDLYAIDMQYYRANKSSKKKNTCQLGNILRPANEVTIDSILEQLDGLMTTALPLLSDDYWSNQLVIKIADQFLKGFVLTLLSDGDHRVYHQKHVTGIYQDVVRVSQFFAASRDPDIQVLIDKECDHVRSVLSVMEIPSEVLIYGGKHANKSYEPIGSLNDDPGHLPHTLSVLYSVLEHRKDLDAKNYIKKQKNVRRLPDALRSGTTEAAVKKATKMGAKIRNPSIPNLSKMGSKIGGKGMAEKNGETGKQ